MKILDRFHGYKKLVYFVRQRSGTRVIIFSIYFRVIRERDSGSSFFVSLYSRFIEARVTEVSSNKATQMAKCIFIGLLYGY